MRPYERLPLPLPSEFDPGELEPDYFYKNFIKHFIPDMLRMTTTGININEEAVEELRVTVDTVLEKVQIILNNSTVIKKVQEYRYPKAFAKYKEEVMESVRTLDYYTKEFNTKNIVHRTYVINTLLDTVDKGADKQEKWTIAQLKKYNLWADNRVLQQIATSSLSPKHPSAIAGMFKLAEDKLELWNRPRFDKVEAGISLPDFNPGSDKNKKELFEVLKIEAITTSKKTGNASWGREQIEEQLKQTTDKDTIEVLQALIDYSYGGIIKSNFLKAFDSYTIDGVLYGNIRLFGAKSFRNTSNSPNLLNMPSTGSIYAKALKKCFVAPNGYIIYTADLSALEDRVIANLSKDRNKLDIFLKRLDGHSVSATYYFKARVEALIGKFTDNQAASVELKALVDMDDVIAGKIRQDSKPVSFGLAYGAYPTKVAAAIKCPLREAKSIFDVYHNELFPGITEYRENYVAVTARDKGYVHLGLGCRIHTDDIGSTIRSVTNATVQFWSILTLIAINEFNYRIDKEDFSNDIKVISTIYDSIYVIVKEEPEKIKWVNDNLIEVMCVQYLEDELIHNEAEGEIGINWSQLTKVKNNASIEEIQTAMEKIRE